MKLFELLFDDTLKVETCSLYYKNNRYLFFSINEVLLDCQLSLTNCTLV